MKNKKMGFILIGSLLLLIIFIVLIISLSNSSKEREKANLEESIIETATKESNSIDEKEKKKFSMIDVDKYLELLSLDDESIVIIGRSGCQYCQIAEPILQKINKDYDLDINYLSTDSFTKEDNDKFLESDSYFKEKGGVSTPTILILEDKKIKNRLEGLYTTTDYINFFKENSVIE